MSSTVETAATRRVGLTREGGSFRLTFAFDPTLVEKMRELPFASFDGETKSWTCQVCVQSVEILRGWYYQGLVDSSVDALVGDEDLEKVAPAVLRPGSLRRPYLVATAIRDDSLYSRLRAISGGNWDRDAKALSYPATAGPALAELVEKGVISDPDKLLSPAEVVMSFDARTGRFVVRGDDRAARAFDQYFPAKDVMAAWRSKGLDVAFADSFSEEVYKGELARAGEGAVVDGFKATLWPYQAQSVALALERTGIGVFHEMGLGKALAVETPVLTPLGWKPIGGLLRGDEVIGQNGLATRVTGVFFQGRRQLYRVSFSDGVSVLADDEHLWQVDLDNTTKVVTTKELREMADLSDATIPLVEMVSCRSEAALTATSTWIKLGEGEVDTEGVWWTADSSSSPALESAVRDLGGVVLHRGEMVGIWVGALAARALGFEGVLGISEPVRRFAAIEQVHTGEAVCIRVDADDHLFVADGHIVTHNTVVALATGHELLFNRKEVSRVVVVVPGAVRTQWAEEIARFSEGEVVVVDGDAKKRAKAYEAAKDASWLVIHYDVLSRDMKQLAPLVAGAFLVADEAHRLKSPTAKRTKAMRTLAGKAARRMALTGTPIQNDPGEWYSVLSGFVVPGCFGSPTDFLSRYAYPSRWGGFEGARNLGELSSRSATYYIRYTKPEVATHLPPLRVQHRGLDVDPTYKAALARAHREARDEIKEAALAHASKKAGLLDGDLLDEVATGAEMTAVGMLRLLCSSPRLVSASDSSAARAMEEAGLLPDADGPKVDELLSLAAEVSANGRRMVVFSFSKRMISLLAERLSEANITHVTFTGDTSRSDRDKAVSAFTAAPTPTDPGPTVFLATDAGGEGLNLGAQCSLLVNMDIPWTPGVLAQRSARIHRLDGTADSYLVINLTLRGTIEEGILRMVERKADLADAVFGEGGGRARTTGRGGKSFFEAAMAEWDENA